MKQYKKIIVEGILLAGLAGLVGCGSNKSTTFDLEYLNKQDTTIKVSRMNGWPVEYDNQGRITRMNKYPVEYDNQGRVSRMNGWPVEYDDQGRIIRMNRKVIKYNDSNSYNK